MKRGLGIRGATVLLVLATACNGAAGDAEKVNERTAPPDSARSAAAERTVVFIGTSLTAGLGLEPESAYPSLVEAKIDSAGLPYTVLNAGISGETSAALLGRLEWLLESDFDVAVIETGANDGLRGIPVETARANIDSVLTRVRAAKPSARVVLVQMEAPPNLGARYTTAFRAMYPALAAKHGAVLLPFLLEGVAGEPRLNQPDGIHPNEEGARRVAENVWGGLEAVLRGP